MFVNITEPETDMITMLRDQFAEYSQVAPVAIITTFIADDPSKLEGG